MYKQKEGSVKFLILIILVVLGALLLFSLFKKNTEKGVITRGSKSDSDLENTVSVDANVSPVESTMNEKSKNTEVVATQMDDSEDLDFMDSEVLRDLRVEASEPLWKALYGDPEKYVKLKWHAGMPYDRTCEVITKDKLPILNEMLSDQKYAPYWHNVARVIGYISDDPNSVSILLDYFKRDDGVNVSSLGGKIWSIAFIGKIGGEQADEILKKAVTEDGAIEIASNWINEELWPDKNWDKSEVIGYIRNAAMRGLVLTRKSDNVDIVKNIYEDEFNRVLKTKKATRLCAYAIDSMAANDFIAEHSMEEYLNLTAVDRGLDPYIMKYSPRPPQN